jgi:preprotein translocase SecE subunit
MDRNFENRNFVVKFFLGLSEQISKIETPVINNFFKQVLIVFSVTLFFSLFFFTVSYFWIKALVYVYGIGN